MKPSRILVCGGRDFSDVKFVNLSLDHLAHWFADEFCVIQGGAKGADFHAGRWADSLGICNITVRANWDFYGNAAGTIRNNWMADFCMPQLCVHFPGGIGTKRMVDYCKFLGIPTYGPI